MRLPILEGLLWRSAIKSFVPVPPASVNVNNVLEAIRLAPSSFGVQPYDVHVVTDVDLKVKLREVSYDQPQVTECSHLLVFCARNDPPVCVDRFINSCELDKSAPKYADSLRESVSPMTPEAFLPWATSQAFIGLGMGLAAAAEEGISSCPMGGFVASDVHRVLGLPQNQWPVVYMAIGSKLDKPSSRPKYRLKKEDLFHFHHGREMTDTSPGGLDTSTAAPSTDTTGTPP